MEQPRQRRAIRVPKRYQDDEVIWDLGVGHHKEPEPEQFRSVYRLLKRKDIRPSLKGREVYLFWPEDRCWYRCIVSDVDCKKQLLYMHYCDEDSYEEISAAEVIRDKHISMLEYRPLDTPLRKNSEIPVNEADRDNATFVSDESSDSDDSTDSGQGNHATQQQQQQEHGSDDSDEELSVRAARAKQREGHKQVNRSLKRGPEGGSSAAEDAAAKRQRTASQRSTSGELASPQDPFKKAMIGAVMHTLGDTKQADGSERRSSSRHTPSRTPQHQQPAKATPKIQPHMSHSDEELRKRARDQLSAALQVAADELHKEGIEASKIAVPTEVGQAVETALFNAHGGLSKEYKTKFRSLVFNLKDVNNPDLRARVLQGELPPDHLVQLSTAELASRQLSAWRQKKEEEFARAKFLDEEAAAKFSTAAAALLKSQRHHEMQKVNDKMLSTQEALMGSGTSAHDDTQEGAQARAAAAAAAVAAAEAAGDPHPELAAASAAAAVGQCWIECPRAARLVTLPLPTSLLS